MARKNKLVKSAHLEMEYTSEQIEELRKCVRDPIYFIETYVKIVHPTKGAVNFELYDYQRELIEMFWKNKDNIILSARQTGKMQPHSAKIATPEGWTTMGEVSVGDKVLTPDGMSASVTDKIPNGIRDVYKITFDDGSSAECGHEHLWDVYIRNKWDSSAANGHGGYVVQKQTLTLQEIIDYREKQLQRKNSQNYNVRIPVVKKVNFNHKDLPLDPYTLGLILGDGGISSGSITFTTKDALLVESIHETVKHFDVEIKLKTSGNGIDYSITKTKGTINKLKHIFNTLGLMGTKSDTKFIPEIYKTSSHKQRLSLLQGLMDTDGTVNVRKNNRIISYTTTSARLRDDVQELVWSLGGRCSIRKRFPQNPEHKLAYDLYISLPCPKDCFRLVRKRNLCHETWKAGVGNESEIRRTITNIEFVRKEESSCIVIDHPDHLYITDNFTVTHNSTCASAFILWFTIFHFDKTVLIASNKEKGAKEMVQRIRYAYEHLPMWLKPGVLDDGWNKHSVGFDNGSRIESTATAEDSGRGMSISLLYLDEFAFVAPNIAEDFWTAIAPTLSTGGNCIITSTPNGDMNLFAQLWRGAEMGINGFKSRWVKWDEPPDRDEKFKEDQIAKLGQRKWDQEYECIFLSSDALLMDSLELAYQTPRLEKLQPLEELHGVKFWKKFEKGRTYIFGVDPATGSGEDTSVVTGFEFPSMEQVFEFRSNTMSPPYVYKVLKNLIKYAERENGTVYFSVENNGVGEGVISLYEADETPPEMAEFVSEEGAKRRGMTTTNKTKMRACVNFKEMFEKHNMVINSLLLLKELKSFVRKAGSYAAQIGATDDSISAVLIILRVLEEIATYDQEAYDKLHTYEDDDWFAGKNDSEEENPEDAPMPMAF